MSVAALVLLLRGMPASSCFWRSFWYAMGLFGSGASWVFFSIHDFGNASAALATSLTLLFITAPALSFALPMTLYSRFNGHSVATILAFPSLWVLAEWFRSWVLTGFPWLYLGYGFIDTPLAGWAPVTGVMSISWIVVFCGVMLALIPDWRANRRTVQNGLMVTVLFWASGWLLSAQSWTTPLGPTFSVGTIQPSLPLTTKWNSGKLDEILSLYRNQTKTLGQQDIIIWPESAIPRLQHEVKDFLQEIDTTATNNQTALIIGIPTQNPQSRQYFNSVIGLGTAEGAYHKQHLVPFGEYVPLEQWLRGTIEFFDLPMSRFSAGDPNQPLIKAKGVNIASAICYEITFPSLVSRLAVDANLLLTVSNDSWFGDSLGPKQHFEMARMRALENGKPLIRATNDGISALIDHRGKVTDTIPAYSRTVLRGALSPRSGNTPFNRWGSAVILLFSLAMILIALSLRNASNRKLR